ncbi:MAG: RNA ligase (ATP) [Alphaproteobacteria bacterium]|nr:RNA ligase (ATP) [Alphaproteobacteria bacterium]
MRKLATIRIIDDIKPIENADKLEKAVIGGWNIVVQKNQFKNGDKCLYFEIDSAIPSDDKRFEFLKERCLKKWMNQGQLVLEVLRIKTIKLRGVISQGLIMPLDEFPEIQNKEVGEDVTDILHIQHYDELAEKFGRTNCRLAGNAKGNFPSHLVPKTDEERLQNLVEYFETKKDIEFECTFKYDGSSMTVLYTKQIDENNPINVCSRNLNLKDENDNIFWNVAKQYDLPEKLKTYCEKNNIEIAIQGELVGPGINNDRDLYTDYHYCVFRIYNISEQKWFTPEERYALCEELGLEHVHVYKKHFKVFNEIKTIEEMNKFVNLKTIRGNRLEGIVFKTYDGNCSFKHINPEYLLAMKD